jgi:hypothetical protein
MEMLLILIGVAFVGFVAFSAGHAQGQLEAQNKLEKLIESGNLKEVTLDEHLKNRS